MRVTLEIDGSLMEEAMRRSGKTSKRATVEEGLRLLVRLSRQEGIKRLRGKVKWVGSLDEMRRD